MVDTNESCTFCLIATGKEHAEIMQKNGELVCFRDINSAAPHHYLIIPRQHIVNCCSLYNKHVGLVERMADMGKSVLCDQGVTDLNNVRLGFHLPPYTSVDHLHLHVLAPASQINTYMEYKFSPGTERFITDESIHSLLKQIQQPSKLLQCFWKTKPAKLWTSPNK